MDETEGFQWLGHSKYSNSNWNICKPCEPGPVLVIQWKSHSTCPSPSVPRPNDVLIEMTKSIGNLEKCRRNHQFPYCVTVSGEVCINWLCIKRSLICFLSRCASAGPHVHITTPLCRICPWSDSGPYLLTALRWNAWRDLKLSHPIRRITRQILPSYRMNGRIRMETVGLGICPN